MFSSPKNLVPGRDFVENQNKQNKRGYNHKSTKPKKQFVNGHNYFEQINISISKSYIKPQSMPKQRPKRSKKCCSKVHNQLDRKVRQHSRDNSQKMTKKVSSFKLSGNITNNDKVLKVDRKKLTKIKSKLKANLEMIDQRLYPKKDQSTIKVKKRFNSQKKQNLFKKLEKLKGDKDSKLKMKKIKIKQKNETLRSRRDKPRKSHNKSIKNINQIQLEPGNVEPVKAKKKLKSSLKSKINKICKERYEMGTREENKKLKTKNSQRTRNESFKGIKLKKAKSRKNLPVQEKKKEEAKIKKGKSSSNFMKKQKIKKKPIEKLNKLKLVPLITNKVQNIDTQIEEVAMPEKKEPEPKIIVNTVKTPTREEPNSIKQIISDRKVNLKMKYKEDLMKVTSQQEIDRIEEWYKEELVFINQIEESLKKTKPKTRQPICENQSGSKLSVNNSFLLTKKTSKTIDLSFNDDRSFKRRGSSVISDPNVINIKKDYMIPMIKSINEISVNISKSYCLFNQKNSVDNAALKKKKIIHIDKINAFCDEIMKELINKYCENYYKRQKNIKKIFKRNEANKLKTKQKPLIKENKLSVTISSFENEIGVLLNELIIKYGKKLVLRLNQPFGLSHIQILSSLMQKESLDFSLYNEYTTKPIITESEWNEILTILSKKQVNEYQKVYLKFVYDCLNEALCSWRPYVYHHQPLSWQCFNSGIYQINIKLKDLKGVMAITQKKLKEWSMLLCGYYNNKEDSCLGDLGIIGNEMLETVKEDRLNKFINWEVIDTSDRWIQYDLETLETKIDIAEEIWEYLIDDLVADLSYSFL